MPGRRPGNAWGSQEGSCAPWWPQATVELTRKSPPSVPNLLEDPGKPGCSQASKGSSTRCSEALLQVGRGSPPGPRVTAAPCPVLRGSGEGWAAAQLLGAPIWIQLPSRQLRDLQQIFPSVPRVSDATCGHKGIYPFGL